MEFKEGMENRAKQFIPFAALKGFDEALQKKETENDENEMDGFIGNTNQIPVPVIASYSSNGKIIPIYFSIEDVKVKVYRIKQQSRMYEWGCRFRCEIVINDVVKEVDLYYYKNKSTWTLKY